MHEKLETWLYTFLTEAPVLVDSRLRFLEEKYQKLMESNLETEKKLSEQSEQTQKYKKLGENHQVNFEESLKSLERQKDAELQLAVLEISKKEVSLIKEAEHNRQSYIENCNNNWFSNSKSSLWRIEWFLNRTKGLLS